MATSTGPGLPAGEHNKSVNPNAGPYIGIVKGYGDDTGMGRIAVYIPALVGQRLSSEINPAKKHELIENIVLCNLALPYYGRTNAQGATPESYDNTTKSYGMWFPTPDVDSQVLVIFVEGDREKGYIISYIPDAFMLHMVPGIPVSPTFHKTDRTTEAKLFSAAGKGAVSADKAAQVPVAEYNKIGHKTSQAWGNIPRPVHPLIDTLLEQGLQGDYARGLSTSGAQRESPSNVFGISTPGPLNTSGPEQTQGLVSKVDDSGYKWPSSRKTGHTFIMDDGDNSGESQLIRLRTGTGHQILLNDTDGIIYIGNATGSAWVEMTNAGQIDIFSKQDVSVHTEGNMNLLADKNVHIQSGEDLVMLAGHNLRVETNPGNVEGKGHAHMHINGNIKMRAMGTFNLKSEDWFNVTSKEAISITTLACMYIKSGGGKKNPIKLNTEAGNQAEAPSVVPKYATPWITLESTSKTFKVDGTYEYTTAMQRVPMHEPDERTHQTAEAPAAGTTPHITEKKTASISH
jgi:hypothetical protein